jgi:hypothetical protein
MANSGTAGYLGGGGDPTISTIDKLTFSNDSRSTIGATFSGDGRYGQGAFANSGTAGYFGGGIIPPGFNSATIFKLAFSNDSISTLAATVTVSGPYLTGFANSGTL